MITAKTYIKIKDKFVDFQGFSGNINNCDYIEGAIELCVNGVVVLDKTMWDCVDQLWAYLVEGVMCIARGEGFKTYFPDQPIEMSFGVQGGNVVVTVTVYETVQVVVDRSEFVSEMRRLAVEFFECMKYAGSRYKSNSDFYLNKLNLI
ncbi:hypothetical protein LGM39_21950 [Burkholderia cepacia]|uniref:hypothetical protein n=1 Tax=Burkholderia cepacia TaxID=292 RepID=UPI001C959F3E|nr:hypothetical protein [Burkholderia cepacia]EMD9437018.1 hypothetical protein [Burkholderia cepacia]MBY4801547.1 hypothetical protein [Burkholderia cepacia]MCA7902038.1 hypothetical protein [Burkholderia cepacia]MCA8328058.1 hypothetical protein [Burkholderia cepacia]